MNTRLTLSLLVVSACLLSTFAAPTPVETDAMRDLFGFDEAKMKEEMAKLSNDPELKDQIAADCKDCKKEGEADLAGFDEEALRKLSEGAVEAPVEQTNQLLQEGEGLASTSRVMNWKKWEKFALGEFEAARLDGTLDAAAHKLPVNTDSLMPVSENLQLEEGNSASNSVDTPTDKMCGCSIELTPVCGSDGETYPSACFAKCAGLSVSHSGSCLAKADLERQDSYKTLNINKNTLELEMKASPQALVSLGNVLEDPTFASEFDSMAQTAPVQSEAGVDFPSLSTADATQAAREADTEASAPAQVNLPFAHANTRGQFNEDLKELSKVAEEFEIAAEDPRLSKCECRGDYNPVCGTDFKTYPSPCYASCVGASLRHIGACHEDSKMEDPVAKTMDEARDPVCFCSFKQKRVCGVNDKTYLNRCFADCENMSVRSEGPCVPLA